MHFFYDAQSRPAFVEFDGAMYRYIHNLQGDIVAIVDTAGNLVVEYRYDAWGKNVIIAGNETNIVGRLNPFKYRGYQYDDELESYYLENRYYNPTLNRFFNADRLVHLEKPGPLVNVFQYGYNSPIVNLDADGNDVESLNGLTGILVFLKDDYDCAISIAEGFIDPIRFLGHTAAIYNGTVYSYGPADGNVLDTDAIVTIMYEDKDVKEYMRTHGYQYCFYMPIDIPDDIDITEALSNVTALRGNRAGSASTYYVNNAADRNLSRYSPLDSNCVEFVKYCYSKFNVDLSNIFVGLAYLPRILVFERINEFERVIFKK